jgi:hypothetical protein
MKLFSIKRLIGLGAIYAGIQYARRHGGPRNAFNELLGKAKDKINEAKDLVDSKDNVAGDRSDFASGSGSFANEERLGDVTGYTNGNGRRGY